MIPTTALRDQQIATALELMAYEMGKTVPNVGDRVSALQVAKLLFTMLGHGYNLSVDGAGKIHVSKNNYCPHDSSFNTSINVLQAHFKNDVLRIENVHRTGVRCCTFENPNLEHGDLSILLAVKDFEIEAAYTYADDQREHLIRKISVTESRIVNLEAKLMAAGDFLSGRRH